MRARQLAPLWQRARARWSAGIELKLPRQCQKAGAIGYIDLRTRQTWLDFKLLRQKGLEHCIEALCAHEVGHHAVYPNTLLEAFRLVRFLREELTDLLTLWGRAERLEEVRSGRWDFLLNLIFDLLINTDLAPYYKDRFLDLYRALSEPEPDLLFAWYLGLYEEGWYLPAGTLIDAATDARLEQVRPGWRLAARATFQFLANHPENRALQVCRFLLDLEPLLPKCQPEKGASASLEGDRPFEGRLTPEEARRAMHASAQERAARAWRAGEEGRPGARASAGTGGGRPGTGPGGDPIRDLQETMRNLCDPTDVALEAYRRMAQRVAVEVPRSQALAEPETPGPTEPWELGDRPEDIDWMSTLTHSGLAVPGHNLEKRTFLSETPRPGESLAPWIEIYVDCSGSMPDPVKTFNYSILAGFILADAALRHAGRVRVISYSHEHRAMAQFAASERAVQRGLLTYVGGGTRFPWDVLLESAARWRKVAAVHRVVISDADFLYNYLYPDVTAPGLDPAQLVRASLAAATRSPDTLLLLLMIPPAAAEIPQLRAHGARVLTVGEWKDLPTVARDLARTLYPEPSPSEIRA